MEKSFNPGDYIITKEGLRGYVIESSDSKEKYYTVRLVSGYVNKPVEDLEKDVIMEDN